MSDVIINIPLDEGISITTNADDAIIINIIDEPDIIVNLCDDNGIVQTDYASLTGKPKINNVELTGNKTLDQLSIEPKKGADDFYLTNAEKTQGALATGVAAFPTVKDGISRVDRLLVDYVVPLDTSSITFDRDKNGVFFSALGLMSVKIITNFTTGIATVSKVKVNGILSNYNNQNTAFNDAIPLNIGGTQTTTLDIDIIKNNLQYRSNVQAYIIGTPSTPGSIIRGGVNSNTFTSIRELILGYGGVIITAGSAVKIYRND